MQEMIQIHCVNSNTTKLFPVGSTLLTIFNGFELQLPCQVVSAKVNNLVEGLRYRIYFNRDVEFLTLQDSSGMRTYVRSLCFILCKAVNDLFPDATTSIEHVISNGYFTNLQLGEPITSTTIAAIKDRMDEIIKADYSFKRVECRTEEAIELFDARKLTDKVKLLQSLGALYTHYYQLDGYIDYFFGSLLPSAGYISLFDVVPYYDGILLVLPDKQNPTELGQIIKQDQLFEAFKEHSQWCKLMKVKHVGELNMLTKKGFSPASIKVAEALQEKKIANIADEIYRRRLNGSPTRIVLIAGPSSSGKTTFSKRLSVQLMTNGIMPHAISLDNYFVERENTPLDKFGEYDFESLHALDLPLFESHLLALLAGQEIDLPTYNFTTGKKEYKNKKLSITDQSVLILEGIHVLNPELTSHIENSLKYKIYVSALTTISLDNHNWIPTSDNRLLRRIIRDYNYRNYSAQDTIMRWESVRRGEDTWIFPYQENADVMFNSALLFELAVLRKYAEPILSEVPENSPAYSEAARLLNFIKLFVPVKDHEIPPTSLLREFLGGSSFRY